MVLSFAYPGDGSRATFVPTSGISASIYNVDESSRTTLAFTCPSAGARSTAGALCPISSNHPIAVTVGPDYFGWDFYRSYNSDDFAPTTTLASDVRVDGALRCAVTSTKTKASPVCTVDVTDIPSAAPTADIMADMQCWEEDVAGPVANQTQGVYNTLSVGSCQSAMSATPTTEYTVTRDPTNVIYWTVTVTQIAAGVTVEPSKGAAASVGVSLAGSAVVGVVAAVLAL
ncbi:hypothetical protein GTA08_BOTSDO09022 [Neofusicoccum parvum]|uniref:Uncharacterized protein n=1 Tax=Neofusicoccum parvum TaxID=310453 RepID=A0ACB5SMD7_9PEZI|nr:hypothetical protein GTA08_BOTSDO09022 [Neofusicoccum parvum]